VLTVAIVAARPGREIPSWMVELLGQPEPDLLAYRPSAHVSWATPDGRVRVAAWQDADRLGIGRRWEVRPSGFTAFGGMPWYRATAWESTSTWAAQLADLFERVPLCDALPHLDGRFAAVSVAVDGTGAVSADPLGLTALYRGEGDEVVVASTRAAVVARLVTPPGQQPERDRRAMAWLVLGGSLHEDRTGFERVRRVPEGTLLELAPDRPLEAVTWDRRPWWTGPPVAPADRFDLIEGAGEQIRALLRVQARLPSAKRRMDLSGGHDSRLVLALLLQEGLQHEFSYVTWGGPTLPDVLVATSLADRYLLDHNSPGHFRPFRRPRRTAGPCPPEVVDDAAPPEPGFVAAARHHCWVTSGGLSLWDRALARAVPSPHVSLTGDLGELLRPRYPAAGGFTDLDEVRRALLAGWLRFDPAGLLHPEVRRELLDTVVAQVAAAAGEGASMQDALDGFYLRNRLRPWHGATAEHDQRNAITPLGSLRVIRPAFALGPEARRDELLAFTLVRAADPDLAKHPFAGPGWPSGVVAGLPDAAEVPTTPVGTGWSRPRRLDPVAALRRARAPKLGLASAREEERQGSFAADLAGLAELVDLGPDHALFDLVDRGAMRQALDRADTAYGARRALYDLATAATWLDRGEAEVPGLSRR
jgi:hypothetical protein